MSTAIGRFLADGTPTAEAIDAFIEEHRPFPIREGSRATFVYRGPANSVHWQHWIFGLTTSQAFKHVEGTDLWY